MQDNVISNASDNSVNNGGSRTDAFTQLNGELKAPKISVYPTLVEKTKNIHIDFEGLQNGIYTIAILNSNGDKIIQEQVNINCDFQSMEIETIDMTNGLYIIHISSTVDSFIQRIIVQ